jgi:hypothetical protein
MRFLRDMFRNACLEVIGKAFRTCSLNGEEGTLFFPFFWISLTSRVKSVALPAGTVVTMIPRPYCNFLFDHQSGLIIPKTHTYDLPSPLLAIARSILMAKISLAMSSWLGWCLIKNPCGLLSRDHSSWQLIEAANIWNKWMLGQCWEHDIVVRT